MHEGMCSSQVDPQHIHLKYQHIIAGVNKDGITDILNCGAGGSSMQRRYFSFRAGTAGGCPPTATMWAASRSRFAFPSTALVWTEASTCCSIAFGFPCSSAQDRSWACGQDVPDMFLVDFMQLGVELKQLDEEAKLVVQPAFDNFSRLSRPQRQGQQYVSGAYRRACRSTCGSCTDGGGGLRGDRASAQPCQYSSIRARGCCHISVEGAALLGLLHLRVQHMRGYAHGQLRLVAQMPREFRKRSFVLLMLGFACIRAEQQSESECLGLQADVHSEVMLRPDPLIIDFHADFLMPRFQFLKSV